MTKLILNRDNVKQLVPAKLYNDATQNVNSMTYSEDGTQMIVSTDDDSILLFDMKTGQKSRSVNSKKYGVSHVKFASNNTCAVHSSTKVDHIIRYLSLADNKYLRYFQGHTETVTGICMSPLDDMFLSVSQDKTIRLWDLKSYNCMGIMNVQYNAIAAFDPEGLIFAAGMNSEMLKLYDLRSFDKGPFSSFAITKDNNSEWTNMKFSPCGKYILLSTNRDSFLLIDAFTGSTKCVFEGHQNADGIPLEASFSGDSKFVFCGSSDKKIYVWDTEGTFIHKYATAHDTTPHITQTSSKYFSVVSAGRQIVLWCPSDDVVQNVH